MSEVKIYKKSTFPRRKWTKEEVRELITMWPTSTYEQLVAKFQRPPAAISFVSQLLRKNGVQLEKKYRGGISFGLNQLIKEVVEGK